MFEAKPSFYVDNRWLASETIGHTAQFLCPDGEIRTAVEVRESGSDFYYPTQAAALAAIHEHYHDGKTEVMDQIPATLESEGEP